MPATLFRQIEVFRAVIEAGGATEAAQRLGLSQPAVSQQIARLEAALGIDLFVRAHGRMTPTEPALALYDEARQAFDGIDRLVNLARDMRGLGRGLLRIAAPHSLGPGRVARAMARLAAARPGVRFDLRLGTYERIVSLVAARQADLGVVKVPVMHPGVETLPLAESGLVAGVAQGSLLARRNRLGLTDIAREGLVMLGRGRPWRDEIDLVFRRAGLAARVAVETQSVAAALGLAAAGLGVAVVPRWVAEDCAPPAVALVPLDVPIRHAFAVAFTSRGRAEAEAFAAALAEVAPPAQS